MKYLVLVLTALLTPRASQSLGCEFICNGGCDFSYKACASVPASIPACLSTQTLCKSSCAKICSCSFQCEIDCMKPQGVCEPNAPAAKKVPCTIQQAVCKNVVCYFKCAFSNLPKGLPSLPKLGDIKNAASILPAKTADLFKPNNGLPANPFQIPNPGLSTNPFQNPNPGLPANPFQNPNPRLSTNPFQNPNPGLPATSVNNPQPAKTSLDIGNTFTNTPNLAAGSSPGSDDSEEQPKTNRFQPAPGLQKDVTKPANLLTNPVSSNAMVPGPAVSPTKKKFNLFGGRQ